MIFIRLGTVKDIVSNGRVIMIGFGTYFDNKRMFRYLNRYKEGKRLQKPFADVIRKARTFFSVIYNEDPENWSGRSSNQRPPAQQTGALPTEPTRPWLR